MTALSFVLGYVEGQKIVPVGYPLGVAVSFYLGIFCRVKLI